MSDGVVVENKSLSSRSTIETEVSENTVSWSSTVVDHSATSSHLYPFEGELRCRVKSNHT